MINGTDLMPWSAGQQPAADVRLRGRRAGHGALFGWINHACSWNIN